MSNRNIKDSIRRLCKQIKIEQQRFEKRRERIENRLNDLYELDSGFRSGDRIKVASVTVRDIHKDSDIAILGKKGYVTKVSEGWITVKLDGETFSHSFLLSSNNVEKYGCR